MSEKSRALFRVFFIHIFTSDVNSTCQKCLLIFKKMFKVSKNLSYDYRARIGNGSNGTIVFDGIFDEKKVAVKKLLVRNIAKFDREKDILQLINLGKKHGNIVNCFGTETTEEFFYLALEICDFNCYKYFHDKQNGSPSPLSIQIRKEFEVMDIMTQTTEGVIFLHALNISE